jgi:hypothetical protein
MCLGQKREKIEHLFLDIKKPAILIAPADDAELIVSGIIA